MSDKETRVISVNPDLCYLIYFIESMNTNVSIIEHNIVKIKYDVKLNLAIFVK